MAGSLSSAVLKNHQHNERKGKISENETHAEMKFGDRNE